MSELDGKPKYKPIKHQTSPSLNWPHLTTYFEFVTPSGLNNCVLMIWQHKKFTNKLRSPISYEYLTVQIQQPLPDIAHFTINITDIQGRLIRAIFQGTLESLNDGSTDVRGKLISRLPILHIAFVLGLSVLSMLMIGRLDRVGPETIILLVPGLVITAFYLIYVRVMQYVDLNRIKSIFGIY